MSFFLDGGMRPFFSTIVWKFTIPPRVQYFLYPSSKDKSLTKANLAKRGWQGNSNCTLCASAIETSNHLFLQCSFSRKVWSYFQTTLGLKMIPPSQAQLWDHWRSQEPMHSLKMGLDILLAARFWYVWKECNKRCFEFHAYLPRVLVQQIRKLFMIWATHFIDEETDQLRLIKKTVKSLLDSPPVKN